MDSSNTMRRVYGSLKLRWGHFAAVSDGAIFEERSLTHPAPPQVTTGTVRKDRERELSEENARLRAELECLKGKRDLSNSLHVTFVLC